VPERDLAVVALANAGPDGTTGNQAVVRWALEVRIKPELRAAADKELPPDIEPSDVGLLGGDGDEYLITEGGMKGLRSVFPRDHSGTIVGMDLAGRLFTRVPAASP
jgi:hypothetical protein